MSKFDTFKNKFKTGKPKTETSSTETNPYEKFLEGLDEVKSKESFESCWNELKNNSNIKEGVGKIAPHVSSFFLALNEIASKIVNLKKTENPFEGINIEEEFFSDKLKSTLKDKKKDISENKWKEIKKVFTEADTSRKAFNQEIEKLKKELNPSNREQKAQGKTIKHLEDEIKKTEAFCKLTENIDNLDKQNISKDKEQIIENYNKDLVDDWKKVCSFTDGNNKDNLKQLVNKNLGTEKNWRGCVEQLGKIDDLNCSIDKMGKEICSSLSRLIQSSENFIKEYGVAVSNDVSNELQNKPLKEIKKNFDGRDINVRDAVYCLEVLLKNLMDISKKNLKENALWNPTEWNNMKKDFEDLFDKFIITKDNINKRFDKKALMPIKSKN